MEVYVFRHGKTQMNIEKRYIGRTDMGLCDIGIEEVKNNRPDLSPKAVFVSPMKRAKETAAIWFPNAEQIEVPDFREMDFGKFEGHTSDEMKDDPDYKQWLDDNGLGTCPEGESLADVMPRVISAFRGVLGEAKRRGIKDLVIVAHGGTVMSIMSTFIKEKNKRQPFDWFVSPCQGWHTKLVGGQKAPNLIHPILINSILSYLDGETDEEDA